MAVMARLVYKQVCDAGATWRQRARLMTEQVFGNEASEPPQVDHSSQKANGLSGD